MSGIIERDRKEYFKEYHEKNKDKRNALSAIRREAKRDEINEEKRNYHYKNKERRTEYIECDCGMKYQLRSKARHFKTKYHIENYKEKDPPSQR